VWLDGNAMFLLVLSRRTTADDGNMAADPATSA
jgi:hypothetical protein